MVMAVATSPRMRNSPTRPNPCAMIVPFSPGGGTDVIGRLLTAKLSASLGQQFIMDNRAGAGSTIGNEIALKSPPDGYTLLLTGVTYTVAARPTSCTTTRSRT